MKSSDTLSRSLTTASSVSSIILVPTIRLFKQRRVSYGKGTKRVSEDKGLIRYLMRHWHTTPFEMCEIKLHVRVPMDCWRQWIRHRTANVNEYSTHGIPMRSTQCRRRHRRFGGSIRSELLGSEGFVDHTLGEELSQGNGPTPFAVGLSTRAARKAASPESKLGRI